MFWGAVSGTAGKSLSNEGNRVTDGTKRFDRDRWGILTHPGVVGNRWMRRATVDAAGNHKGCPQATMLSFPVRFLLTPFLLAGRIYRYGL